MHLNLVEAALGTIALIAVPVTAVTTMTGFSPRTPMPMADTVEIAATTLEFPRSGEFLAAGHPIVAPTEETAVPMFTIMKHQVALADYERCVADGACKAADARKSKADVPATGVNWLDAKAYADWYSQATGETWRLPSAIEAAAAAAERFSSDAFSAASDDPANPAIRWIRQYREEAAVQRPADPKPKPRGFYGPNSKGVEDFGGNVWEWTSTCYERVTLSADRSRVEHRTENCGVHVLEGRHRAYMSDFVRVGKSGGCAVGTPPDNLGFRLVRETGSSRALNRLVSALGALRP